jgi:hypothetical protein
MSPFGTGILGALHALKGPVPPTNIVNDAELERYLRIVLDALQNKIADRSAPLTQSKTRINADLAHITLVEQGLRLLVIERIMKARNQPPPARMSDWLRTVRMSAPVIAALRGAGLHRYLYGHYDE